MEQWNIFNLVDYEEKDAEIVALCVEVDYIVVVDIVVVDVVVVVLIVVVICCCCDFFDLVDLEA